MNRTPYMLLLCLLLSSAATACYDVGPVLLDPPQRDPGSDGTDDRDPSPGEDPTDDVPTDPGETSDDTDTDPVETPPILPPDDPGPVSWVEIRWNRADGSNAVNLDLHVQDPDGAHIFYLNTVSGNGAGQFAEHPDCPSYDCDGTEPQPSERIEWDTSRMSNGVYEVWVTNDGNRAATFELEINVPGTQLMESGTVGAGQSSSTWVFEVSDEQEEPGDCYAKLRARGVTFRPITISSGECTVQDAVLIPGRVNGIMYRYAPSPSTTNLRTSCEIALRLYESAEVLKQHDVDTVYHIGSYECRYVAGTHTWSQHAFGRAMDYRAFGTTTGARYDVEDHWEHNTTQPKTKAGQVLRELATGLSPHYDRFLDADHDRHHDNHFHAELLGR